MVYHSNPDDSYYRLAKTHKIEKVQIKDMLEDGFRSHRYSDILGNLSENGFLTAEDVGKLLKEFTTTQKITFACISDEKAQIVSEALIDNYQRSKSN